MEHSEKKGFTSYANLLNMYIGEKNRHESAKHYGIRAEGDAFSDSFVMAIDNSDGKLDIEVKDKFNITHKELYSGFRGLKEWLVNAIRSGNMEVIEIADQDKNVISSRGIHRDRNWVMRELERDLSSLGAVLRVSTSSNSGWVEREQQRAGELSGMSK